MKNDIEFTESGHQYAKAYAAHYTERDLPKALQLYTKVMASHPDTQEADYARMQVQNIVNAVVPKQEILDAQRDLALVHLSHDGPPNARRTAVRPLVSGLST